MLQPARTDAEEYQIGIDYFASFICDGKPTVSMALADESVDVRFSKRRFADARIDQNSVVAFNSDDMVTVAKHRSSSYCANVPEAYDRNFQFRIAVKQFAGLKIFLWLVKVQGLLLGRRLMSSQRIPAGSATVGFINFVDRLWRTFLNGGFSVSTSHSCSALKL
jgi:hypothetical protein